MDITSAPCFIDASHCLYEGSLTFLLQRRKIRLTDKVTHPKPHSLQVPWDYET